MANNMKQKFDTSFQELKDKFKTQKIDKPNILLAGKTGVGKSTLLNAMFSKNFATTGVGKPVTQKIDIYEDSDFPLRIIDSKGLEGQDYQKIKNDLDDYIAKQSNTGDPATAINIAWYCVSASGGRFEDADGDVIKAIGSYGIPVLVVLTKGKDFIPKSDLMKQQKEDGTETDNYKLSQYIKNIMGDAIKGVYLVRAKDDSFEDDDGNLIKRGIRGLGPLIDATNKVLPEGKKNAFAQALRTQTNSALVLKRTAAENYIMYARRSSIFTGALPGLNLVALGPIIGLVCHAIGNVYGLKKDDQGIDWGSIAKIGAEVFGISVGSAMLDFVPGLGSIIGATVSYKLTKSIGESYINLLEEEARKFMANGQDEDMTASQAVHLLADKLKSEKK